MYNYWMLYRRKMNVLFKRSSAPAVLFLVISAATTSVSAQNVVPSVHDGVSPASYTAQSFNSTPFTRDGDIYDNVETLLSDFYPTLAITYSKHDNVMRDFDGSEDTVLTVSPGFSYRTDIGQHSAYISYQGQWRKLNNFKDEESTSHNLDGLTRLRVGSRSQIDLFGGLGRVYERRGASGSRPFGEFLGTTGYNPDLDTGPDEVKLGFYGVEGIYGGGGASRIRLAAGVQRQNVSYGNNNQGDSNISGNRDRVRTQYHIDAGYELTNATSVFGRYELSDVDFERAIASLDSEEMSFLVGLRWAPTTSNLSGQIGIGNIEKDFVDPARSDFDGTRYYANLNYTPTQFLDFGIFASKYIEETGDQLSDYYVSNILGASANYSFSDRLNGYVFGKLISDEYELGRVDDFKDYGVGLKYDLYRWLALGLQYTHTERDSTLEQANYTDNYYGITLSSDLRGLYQ